MASLPFLTRFRFQSSESVLPVTVVLTIKEVQVSVGGVGHKSIGVQEQPQQQNEIQCF